MKTIRELLNKKIGINLNYECENVVGDNERFDSRDFNEEEVSFLEQIDVTPVSFKKIYEYYNGEILRVINRNPYMKIYAIMDSNSDSITYDENKINESFLSLFNDGAKLGPRNKIVLKTFLELIDTYEINELLNNRENIHRELKNGIFDIIKNNKKALSKNDREKINKLEWEKQDVENWYNLPLLKSRLEYIASSNNKEDINSDSKELLKYIEYIEDVGIPEKNKLNDINKKAKVTQSEFITKLMKNIYKNYEILNRRDIIYKLYDPQKVENKFDKEENMSGMLLHFYRLEDIEALKNCFTNLIINRELYKEGKDIIQGRKESFKSRLGLEKKYKNFILNENIDECVDPLLPSKSFEIKNEDKNNNLGYRLDTLQVGSKQLATTLYKNGDIDKRRHFCFAVGFKNISPENIILTKSENADSNLGEENIPYKNKFEELSMTYGEIMNSTEKRKEILLKRKDLKADYLFCWYDPNKIDYSTKKRIKEEIERAKEKGIKIVEQKTKEPELEK